MCRVGRMMLSRSSNGSFMMFSPNNKFFTHGPILPLPVLTTISTILQTKKAWVHNITTFLLQQKTALSQQGFGGFSPSKQSTKPPNWKMKHYKSVDVLSNFQYQVSLHKRKAPYWKLSGDSFGKMLTHFLCQHISHICLRCSIACSGSSSQLTRALVWSLNDQLGHRRSCSHYAELHNTHFKFRLQLSMSTGA